MLNVVGETVERLGDTLRRIGYLESVQTARAVLRARGPWPGHRELATYAERVGGAAEVLLRLLMLGEPADARAVESVFGGPLLDELAASGVLAREGRDVVLPGRGLTACGGLLLLADLPATFPARGGVPPDVYIGLDSMVMAGIVPGVCGSSMVDVCTGAGLLALTGARAGATVAATELSPAAAAAARFNAHLNGLAHRVTIHEGSFLDPLTRGPVDLLCSNPPFVAVPTGFGGCLPFDGGSDGLRAVREILAGADDFLGDAGRAIVLGGVYARPDGYDAGVGEIEALARRHRWDATMLVLERQPVALHARLLSSFVPAAAECEASVLAQAERDGWTEFVIFLLQLRAGAPPRPLRIVNGAPLDRWPESLAPARQPALAT